MILQAPFPCSQYSPPFCWRSFCTLPITDQLHTVTLNINQRKFIFLQCRTCEKMCHNYCFLLSNQNMIRYAYLMYLYWRNMWNEIISCQETNKYEIIYKPLNICFDNWVWYLQIKLQILPQNPYVQKLQEDGVIKKI